MLLPGVGAAQSPREAAVLRFRAGDRDAALADLRAQLAAGSTDPALVPDLVTLLQQAGHSADAVALWEHARPNDPPDYALAAMVRAYRDQRRFDQAVALARDGLRRFPSDPVWPLLLGLALADDGRGDDALAVLAGPAASRAPLVERLLAQGYAARRADRPYDALRYYGEAARHDPGNTEAPQATRDLLIALRAPWGAAAVTMPPGATAQTAPVAADMAAAEVRWGTVDRSYDPAHRFAGTDRALANIDRLLAANPNGAVATQLRLDRIVALRDRVRMDEAVAEADRLRSVGVMLPPYARQAMADALLYLRRPRDALPEYEAVLAADPSNMDAAAGRIYALVEMEDYSRAYAAADELAARQPEWRRFVDDPTLYPRSEWLDAILLAGLVRYYGDQPAKAWARIAPERDAAPGNVHVRLAAASVMSGREWPREAEQENRIALSIAPALAAAQIAVAESALARRRYAEARARIAELAELYPENRQVQRLERELAAATGWQLNVEFSPANERGGGANGDGKEMVADVTIASPLIDNLWRVTAGYGYANAHPPEGFADRQRYALGVSMELPDVTGSFAVHQDLGSLSRTGYAAAVDWTPSDHWSLGASVDRYSADTPLRALLNGITADSVTTRMIYTWNEATKLSIGGAYLPFSDGNRRFSADARLSQVLLAVPEFRLTGTADLYSSTNSLSNVPYYSPAADGSATVGLLAEHTLWRSYERSLTQVIGIDGGWYGERNFAGGPIGSITYEHRWRFDPWTELRYGVSIAEHIYDGSGARTIGLIIALRQNL